MSEPVRVFIGTDPRQWLGYNVLQSSIHRHAKGRVQVEPLILDKLPIKRRGLTEFTYSRFLVPYLCGYEGTAIFMDADIVVTGDVAELAAQADGESAVQVMQEQAQFEWASVMLFNNWRCTALTPKFIDDESQNPLALQWGKVGKLPPEWNYCVGYAGNCGGYLPRLFHYTQGLPCWHETKDSEAAEVWNDEHDAMLHTVDWAELMAKSVHAKPVIKRLLARYGIAVA